MHLTALDSICGHLSIAVSFFLRLAQQAAVEDPVVYAGLVKGAREGQSRKYKTLG